MFFVYITYFTCSIIIGGSLAWTFPHKYHKFTHSALSGILAGKDHDDHDSNQFPGRTYSSYVVYKGRAACSFKIVPPTYSVMGDSSSRIVSREGGMLLEIAPTGIITYFDIVSHIIMDE